MQSRESFKFTGGSTYVMYRYYAVLNKGFEHSADFGSSEIFWNYSIPTIGNQRWLYWLSIQHDKCSTFSCYWTKNISPVNLLSPWYFNHTATPTEILIKIRRIVPTNILIFDIYMTMFWTDDSSRIHTVMKVRRVPCSELSWDLSL